MKKKLNSKLIATTGLLLAIEIIFQLLVILVPGTVNINLSLIPVTLGAILFGPIVGGFLGFMNGVIVLCSPNTVNVFMAINVGGTVLTCLTKVMIAGIVAGFIAKWLKNKKPLVGSILASITVPVINTLLFSLYCYFFFKGHISGLDSYAAIFTSLIGINFAIEIAINLAVVPLLIKIIGHLYPNGFDYHKN